MFHDNSFATIDWTCFAHLVLEHGVAGLISPSLPFQPEEFPSDLSAAFGTFLKNQRADNQQRTEAFVADLQALQVAGVPVIPFKGPLLAESVYGDIGLRTFWDFDFLFPVSRIRDLDSVLESRGYTGNLLATNRQNMAYWNYSGQAVYSREHDRMWLEPHIHFSPNTLAIDLDYDSIWERAISKNWRGIDIQMLSPEDEFMQLAIHGGKEAWFKLKFVCDLAWFLKAHQAMDWDYIIRTAKASGSLGFVQLALLRVESTFSITPNSTDLNLQPDKNVIKASRRIQDSRIPLAPEIYQLNPYFVLIRERWIDRLKYVYRTLLTPRRAHYGLIPLLEGLFFLYVPIKIIYGLIVRPLLVLRNFIRERKRARNPDAANEEI